MSEIINLKEYWEKRFSEKDWENSSGRQQTSFFYNLLVEVLPQWLISDFIHNKMSIADLGCAEGQGTAVLSSRFGANASGFDAFPSDIETARKLYGDIAFQVLDLLHMSKSFNVRVISIVLEHFASPFDKAKEVVKNTANYLTLMLQFEEEQFMAEHVGPLLYNTISMAIGGMHLVNFSEVDCRVLPNKQFMAEQILLVYLLIHTIFCVQIHRINVESYTIVSLIHGRI